MKAVRVKDKKKVLSNAKKLTTLKSPFKEIALKKQWNWE